MTQKSFPNLIAAGFLLVAVLVGVFLYVPTRDRLAGLAAQTATSNAELAELNGKLANLVSLEANLPVGEIERQRLLTAVPDTLKQDELIEDLSSIASEVGISLNSVSFSLQKADHDGEAGVVVIMGNFIGNYSNLVKLLQALEGNARLFKVTSIGVQLGDVAEDGQQQMIFNVSLEAYYQTV